jgi:protoporphyrinogen oxidase
MDVIIGAGISGISYAGFSGNDYLIIERDNEIGGYCKTIKQNDFVWDYSGHFFHFQNKWLEEYIVRNMKNEIINCQKHTQIRYKEKYIDFPFQKNIHQLDRQEFIDCLYDLFDTPDSNYSTFKQMLYVKFGKSIAEKFLIPYNEKLYACDLNLLDIEAMGRFFPHANKKDIVLNFKKANNTSYNTCFTYPRGGAIEYVNALSSKIYKNKLSINEKVTTINVKKKVVYTNKRKINYDNLISSIPFPDLLKICNVAYNETIYSWNKVLVFNLGFDKKGNDVVNNWIYFPDKEISFYRIGYYDNIFMDRRMSLYVELGFDKYKSIDIEYYMQKVMEDLQTLGIVTDHKLIASHYVVMNPAYVHITKKSIEDVKQWKNKLSEMNIYSIGRYGSWTYCSIEDNILEAKALATNLKIKNI